MEFMPIRKGQRLLDMPLCAKSRTCMIEGRAIPPVVDIDDKIER